MTNTSAVVGNLLRIAAVLLVALAAATLVPVGGTHMLSDLGYRTFCPFAPYSTAALLVVAGIAHVVRRYMLAAALQSRFE